MFEKLEFPNRITIELTNRCNVSCTFCPRQTIDMPMGDMDYELFKKIIDEASEHLPVTLVIFFRGESLLYDRFEEAVIYAKKRGIGPIQLASNALILDEKAAEMLIKCELDYISFSLDTLNEKIYSESRKYGDLKLSMDNVIAFSKKCKALKREGKFAPRLQVSTIEMPIYLKEQEEFVEFWIKYVDMVRVYYEHDDAGHFVDQNVDKLLLPDSERKPCRKVMTDLLIYWNGKIALCNYDWKGKAIKLDLLHYSISEIWNSEEFERVREMHLNNTYSDDIICKECSHWKIDYVNGGFLGKAFKGIEEKDK